MKPNRIYLACPYSHEDKAVEQERFELATKEAAILMKAGNLVYSPLTHGHTLCQYSNNLGTDFETHKAHCLSFITHWAQVLFVLTLPGYDTSLGVQAEIEHAKSIGIPVFFVKPS